MKLKLPTALLIAFAATITARADPVDEFVTAQMQSKHIPGVAIAVVKDGKPIKIVVPGILGEALNNCPAPAVTQL